MDTTETAILLPGTIEAVIEGVVYKPTWSFKGTAYSGFVELVITIHTSDSDVRYAPEYFKSITVNPFFSRSRDQFRTEQDVVDWVFACIMWMETHDAREFFSIHGASFDKPFHPHTNSGIDLWNRVAPVIMDNARKNYL